MGETDILDQLYKELRLDIWWKDLLGQEASFDSLDIQKAIESIPRTEQTAAEAISLKLKNYVSYVEATKRWYIWDGRIHTPCDGDGIAIKIVKIYRKATTDALAFVKDFVYREAQAARVSNVEKADEKAANIQATYDKGELTKHRMFRDRLSGDAGITAVVRMLRTECDVPSDYFDNDQRWFVMRNYVLDLDGVRRSTRDNVIFDMLPHSPDRPVTKYFDADWHGSEVNLGHWDGFLERSIPSASSRAYLQEVMGAAMMGTSKLRCIINLYGPPGSGKSVFINTMFQLGREGAGYVCMPDSKAVEKVSGQNFEQDSFKGRRLIGISEPSHTAKIDDDFLKKFTGDIWVETRTLNVKSTGWVPQGVVCIASNAPLKINTRDKAIVERVQLVEFPVEFERAIPGIYEPPAEKRMEEGLEEKVLDDRSRILHWIVMGMYTFVFNGKKLSPPEEVVAKRNAIVTNGSTALTWVEEAVDQELIALDFSADAEYCITLLDAYNEYQLWATMAGEKKPLTRKFFEQDIANKYAPKIKDSTTKQWRLPGFVMTPKYLTRNAGEASVSRF